jgi:hypothetical protein
MSKKIPNKRNYAVLLTCFILAFLAWFIVKMSVTYTVAYKFDIQFYNLPKDKTVFSLSDSVITVTFEEKGMTLLPVEFSNKKIYFDYNEITSSYQKRYNNICLQERQLTRYIKNQHSFSQNIKNIQPDKICLQLKNTND